MQFVSYPDWKTLPESADSLFEAASRSSIFFSRPWFENLVKNGLAQGQGMLLAGVIQQDRLLALLPLLKQADGQFAPLTHLYSSLYSLLLADQYPAETLACLVSGLEQLGIQTLQFTPAAADDARLQRLKPVMAASGFQCHDNFRFYNWIHRVDGQSFQDYMADRPARVRNTIARKQRKLAREQGYEIRLYTDKDLDTGLADFRTVYRASWKAKELFDDFITGLANELANAGWLRLGILYIKTKPVAAQFWFVAHKKASIFKLAYDESWKQYSPGSILIHYLMRQVIDNDRVDEIDFLTGNDAYKSDWMTERRERIAVYFGKPAMSRSKNRRLFAMINNRLLNRG